MRYVIALILVIFLGCSNEKEHPVIGIVVPMEHDAMDIIVGNFISTLSKNHEGDLVFKVQNAHNDTLLQRSIVQQFVSQDIDLIVPIGTNTTNMTISLAQGRPVLGMAILEEENTAQQYQIHNATGVHDELSAYQQLPFLTDLFPDLSKMTIVFSASEKVFKEVQVFEELAKNNGIAIQKLMINNLTDMNSVSKVIDSNSELIFIFKDHLVVSGTTSLAQTAYKMQIPLISSDEGSVVAGASCALGVRESAIGIQGAYMAEKILSGTPPKDIPIKHLEDLTIFINPQACSDQAMNTDRLKNLQYEVFQL
jgi:putative tryptophan/tyrosine transport system substrate-binding protein